MPGEQVLLDLNVLAGDSDYFALGAYDLAPGQDLLLYSTDHDGSEKYTMRVRDLRTGTDLDDVIPETTYGSAWAGDDTFFYVRPDATMRPFQVWRHTVGTPADDDVLVYEDPDERFFVSVGLSLTEQWVHISSELEGDHRGAPRSRPPTPRAPPTVVQPREQGVEYDVTHAPSPIDGDRFVVLTNADGAVNFKLMTDARRPTSAASTGRSSWPTAPR